jgi:hypothetical protein
MAGWVRVLPASYGSTVSIFELADTSLNGGLLVYTAADKLVRACVKNGTRVILSAAASSRLLNGSWHRLHITCDASTHTLTAYVDGVVDTNSGTNAWSGSFAATCRAAPGGLPAEFPSVGAWWADLVLDVGHAWTAADVAADYIEGTIPSTVTHRWPLDDGAGSSARATLGGLPLTLSGGAAFLADSPMLARGVVRNCAAYSEDYTRVTQPGWWTVPGGLATATPGAVANPIDGAMTGQRITAVAGAGYHYVTRAGSLPYDGSSAWIYSLYVQRDNNDWIFVTFPTDAQIGYFNASTGVFGTLPSGVTGYVEAIAGTTWYRLHLYGVPAASAGNGVGVGLASGNGGANFTATGSERVNVFGPMLELAGSGQTTASPYVPTGSAPLSVYGLRERRQNLLPASENFAHSCYTKVRSFVSATIGGGSYDWIEDGSASTTHELRINGTGVVQVMPGMPATIVVRAKKGARDWIALFGNGGGSYCCYNLATGVIGTMAGVMAVGRGMLPVPGQPGWYDCWHSYISDGTSASIVQANADNGVSFSGVNGQVATYVARAQLARTNTLPDYIATYGSPANSSGAPRGLASGRVLKSGRVLA